VLLSGTGTLLEAVLAACQDGWLPATVALVLSDRPSVRGLQVARDAGVPTAVVEVGAHADRSTWDVALASTLTAAHPDLVVSAGFLRILGPAALAAFPHRIVNTHPALLPAFPGAHAVRDALAYGVQVTGCTVHLVDAGVDTGPVLAQRAVDVLPGDDEATLHERIKQVERALLVEVLRAMLTAGWSVQGRRVLMPGGSVLSSDPTQPGPPTRPGPPM
jgi:phosphoribosylglycinamide formyltransferase-1